MATNGCPLCSCGDAEAVLWSDEHARVILVDQGSAPFIFPGYCRVIWNRHVAEMTDLSDSERRHLMEIVWWVEQTLRSVFRPYKINLASLGNVVPHLHWHLIPRWIDDSHFPESIWAVQPENKLPLCPEIQQQRLADVCHLRSQLLMSRVRTRGN